MPSKINNRKVWMIKSDYDTKKILDDIRKERFKKDLDNEPIHYNELLNASLRFEPLLDILKRAKINKKNERR